jgi:hypothetical protein
MSEQIKNIVKSVLRGMVGAVRWVIRKFKESESSSYKLTLKELIDRAETRFFDATGMRAPLCPYTGDEMMFRHSKVVTTVGPVRDDQGWKCTSCFHTAHFGIPMYRDKAEREIHFRGGQTLMRPSDRPDEDGDAIVRERLRRLGYLE